MTSVCRNTCQPAARIVSVFVGDGIERDAPALGERRPQILFRDTAIVPDLMSLMSSEDVKEGLQSFVDRRPAKFIGR